MCSSSRQAICLGIGNEEALCLLQAAEQFREHGQWRQRNGERIDLFIHDEAELDIGPEPGTRSIAVESKFFGVGGLEQTMELFNQGMRQGLQ